MNEVDERALVVTQLVRSVQAGARLRGQAEEDGQRHAALRLGAPLERAERLAVDPLHHEVEGLALLAEVAAVYQARAEHKGLVIETKVAPHLPNDLKAPTAVIRQILVALVDNAVKFTASGAVILSVEGDARKLLFGVRDTGIGLTAKQLEWIALPFAQVDGGRARRNTGIGLGLPLARRLATSLGGELSIVAQPSGGTLVTFSVLLSAAN